MIKSFWYVDIKKRIFMHISAKPTPSAGIWNVHGHGMAEEGVHLFDEVDDAWAYMKKEVDRICSELADYESKARMTVADNTPEGFVMEWLR